MRVAPSIADRDGFWIALSLLVRLPLVLLPAPGRDEATYHAWAAFDHGGYAPLLLSMVRIAEAIVLPPLVAVRTAALVAGTALIWAVRHHLRVIAAPPEWRRWLSAAIVFSPWFVYAGAILHPDALLTTCMIASITAWVRSRPGAAAGWAVAAALAKPSGIVVSLAIAGLLISDCTRHLARVRSGVAALVAVGGGVVALLILGPTRAGALGELARIDPSTPIAARAAILCGSMFVCAGPLLPVLALRGGFTGGMPGTVARRARTAALGVAVAWCVAFTAAWVFRDQFKPNWWMPAFILFASMPIASPGPSFRAWVARGLVPVGALMVIVFGAAFVFPSALDAMERNSARAKATR